MRQANFFRKQLRLSSFSGARGTKHHDKNWHRGNLSLLHQQRFVVAVDLQLSFDVEEGIADNTHNNQQT